MLEEEFEKKSSKKFLKILIPIIILVALIGAVVAYYFMRNTPKNIFVKAVDMAFQNVEEEKFDTIRTNVELSMNIESDNSEVQSVGQIINSVKLSTNQEVDLNSKIANEAISVSFLGQELVNLEYIIKDETSYMFLKDIFSKYIELPLDELGYEGDFFKIIEETKKLTSKEVLEELNKIITTELKDKTYEQTKEDVIVNGETVKATKSTLVLTPKEAINILSSILSNVKNNEKIMDKFPNKDDIRNIMQELIDEIQEISEDLTVENEEKIKLSIYTKGLKNEFVRFEIELADNEQSISMDITKVSKNNYKISILEDKVELFNISIIDEKKDEKSGIMTIKIDMSNAVKETNSGLNTLVMIINNKYNVEHNAKIENPEITESVKYNEMTEEDMNEMLENLQKTELYTLLEQSGLIDTLYLNNDMEEVDITAAESEPEVTLDNYTVKYAVPNGFSSASYNTADYKYYFDEKLNSAIITIEKETKSNYLDFLKEADALTSDLYENQEISGVKTITVGNKEFSYRTITYTYNGFNYADSYYCYEIDEGYLYVVETSIEEGTVLEADLNKFLEIQL